MPQAPENPRGPKHCICLRPFDQRDIQWRQQYLDEVEIHTEAGQEDKAVYARMYAACYTPEGHFICDQIMDGEDFLCTDCRVSKSCQQWRSALVAEASGSA